MAEGMALSHYVKLTKEQDLSEEIRTGELNQPIDVPQLAIQKCHECGQILPESYQPPADEDWMNGIFSCTEDSETCWKGLLCPCVLYGQNVERLKEDVPWSRACMCHAICIEGGIAVAAVTAATHGMFIEPSTAFVIFEGLLFSWWACGIYTGLFRQSIQKKYHLRNSPCDPCMVHCCLHWCAICQEQREMKGRLSSDTVVPMTVVNPPPTQQMSAAANDERTPQSSSSSTENGPGHKQLEMQAL